MKKLIAMLTVMAFACAANAHCGSCGTGDSKPKAECKKCKECKGECECKCHKKKAE